MSYKLMVPPGSSPAYSRINITAPASPTTLHTYAYEDGTDRRFRNVGIYKPDAGNYPKGNLLYSVHGESLKSRIAQNLFPVRSRQQVYKNAHSLLSDYTVS